MTVPDVSLTPELPVFWQSVYIEHFSEFGAFAERHGADWERIARASARATIFQTWEWTAAWWAHHGQSQRFRGIAFREGGNTVGLAALYSPAHAPLQTMRFAGTGGSDYLDIVALPDCEESVSSAFFRALGERPDGWDWGDFQQVRPDAVVTCALSDSTPPPPLRAEVWPGETCPILPLPGDWEAFRKTLGKKLRQNIGYYERALEKQYGVSYRLATAETLTADLDAFFALHQERWRKRWMPGAFAQDAARRFHADAAARLLASDMLRLHTLTLDGTIRAALYCFQKGDRCYYYLGGFAPELAKLSIGTVLTARAIRHAIEADGATEFDFLRGDEPYKYRWGAQDRYNRRLSVTRAGSVRSALLAATGHATLALEMRLKTWMHQKHGGGKSAAGGKQSDG